MSVLRIEFSCSKLLTTFSKLETLPLPLDGLSVKTLLSLSVCVMVLYPTLSFIEKLGENREFR